MQKFKKIFFVVIAMVLFVGCSSNGGKGTKFNNVNNKVQAYYDKVNKMVADKGYTIEEISALTSGQEVDKAYDNEVLIRFGKIQGYLYDVTEEWNDGLIEGPIVDKRTEYSILPPDKIHEEYKDYYEDNKHFSKYTVQLSKYIIFDSYYDSDLVSCYWKNVGDLPETGTYYSPLSEEDKQTILELKDDVTQVYDETYTQLKLPNLSKDKKQ